MAGNLAGLGKFSDGMLSLEHQLHHSESHGMRQRPQTFGSLSKMVEANQLCCACCFHNVIISDYRDMSIGNCRILSQHWLALDLTSIYVICYAARHCTGISASPVDIEDSC